MNTVNLNNKQADNASRSGANPFPENFSFSQSSLQAYEECPRRFWLAFVQQLPWPALEAAPALEFEQQLRWGSVFHKLVERAETGLEVHTDQLPEPLLQWWNAYAAHRPADLDLGQREVEFVLNAAVELPPEFAGLPGLASTTRSTIHSGKSDVPVVRLAAKYDLVSIVEDGPIIIVDWKTGPRRPKPETLQRKWQTALYPFILIEAAASLDWGPIAPERVELRYWFAAEPDNPISFRYSQRLHEDIRTRIQTTVQAIFSGNSEGDFPKIPDTEANRRRFCQYCIYRSRCDRGISAGPIDDPYLDDAIEHALDSEAIDNALDFTLDDVGELSF